MNRFIIIILMILVYYNKSYCQNYAYTNNESEDVLQVIQSSEEVFGYYFEPEYGLGLGTNALTFIFIPNLEVELRLNKEYAIATSGYYSYWNMDNGNKTFRIWDLEPEVRQYFGLRKRLYFGFKMQVGEMNIKLSDTGRQGNIVGGSVTCGRLFKIGTIKNKHPLFFEIGGSVGFLHFSYDKYSQLEGVKYKTEHKLNNYFGPTGLKASFKIGF